jgi:sulfhydrogenase subunit beta (sulfur reductase)
MIFTITKKDFTRVVRGLFEAMPMIAPVTVSNGELIYERVQNTEEITLQPGIPLMSAKEFFLCGRETLFDYKRTETGDIEFFPPEEPEETVFLGIRSCDLKGVRFLEQFFTRQFNDTTVTRKIERTIFFSVGCIEPEADCFCVCCDSGPFLPDGYDAQLTDLDDRWIVETATQKAETLLEPYRDLFLPATDSVFGERKQILDLVDARFARRSYMAMGVKKVSLGTVQEEIWNALGDRCIGCGSCVYVCPTCSCFNVHDRGTPELGARIRTWDACNYSGFTREVSGHNPRHGAADRLKRRFFHKLSHLTMNTNGRLGCMGCGRCVMSCPSLADISTFVTALRGAKAG